MMHVINVPQTLKGLKRKVGHVTTRHLFDLLLRLLVCRPGGINQIWSLQLYPFQRYRGGRKIIKVGHVTWATPFLTYICIFGLYAWRSISTLNLKSLAIPIPEILRGVPKCKSRSRDLDHAHFVPQIYICVTILTCLILWSSFVIASSLSGNTQKRCSLTIAGL